MIGTPDGFWYSFTGEGPETHAEDLGPDHPVRYEFYRKGQLLEHGSATVESMLGRFDQLVKNYRTRDEALLWMSGPVDGVEQNAYNHGPSRSMDFHPDVGDIIVGKNRRGETIVCETWDGKPYLIPKSHTVPKGVIGEVIK